MTTYTWKISQLECIPSSDGKNNIVSTVHWRFNADDGENIAEVYGSQTLNFDVNNSFINYSDLTKNTVVNWVQKEMGIDVVNKLQESLDKQLENLANPPIVTPVLPWLK